MMSCVQLETCWVFNKFWNNKFYYKVASCWLFLLIHTAMHESTNIKHNIRFNSEGKCNISVRCSMPMLTMSCLWVVRASADCCVDHSILWIFDKNILWLWEVAAAPIVVQSLCWADPQQVVTFHLFSKGCLNVLMHLRCALVHLIVGEVPLLVKKQQISSSFLS
jgi:hypothetical protein